MNIVVKYDSSVSSAPAGFTGAVAAAVSYLDSVIASPITVNIDVGWGELDGASLDSGSIGESQFNGGLFSYNQVRSALTNAATSTDDFVSTAILPLTDPTGGSQFFVTSAEEKALGLISANSSGVDGWVGLSSSASYTFDPQHRAVSGDYDAIGILEHEITEVMGRGSGVGQTLTDGTHYTTPLDLFRYSQSGQETPKADGSWFSINGQQLLNQFNSSSNGGDSGDWANVSVGDAFDESASTGTLLSVTQTDVRELDVLGYTLSPTYQYAPSMAHVVGDFNGDGLSDILWFNASTGQESVWRATGSGFIGAGVASAPAGWTPVGYGDFNGDGKADILWFNAATSQESVWQSNGSGFYGVGVQSAPQGWVPIGVGDVNGDGKADIVWFNPSTSQESTWQSSGHGFAGTGVQSAPPGWAPVGLGDFNADGKSDILWFDSSTNQVSVWLSTASGFQGAGVWSAPAGWVPVGVGDFDGDRRDDILWFNPTTDQVSIWRSEGPGLNFVGQGVASAPAGWAPFAVGYFGGAATGMDGIAWFNASAHEVSVWEPTGGAWQSTSASLAGTGVESAPAGWTPIDPFQTGIYGLHLV